MWKLYDELINQIPDNLAVEKFVIGTYRSAVFADGHTGLASTVKNYDGSQLKIENYQGKSLRQMATLIKSWDFTEASLGLAALNSYYNRIEKINAKSLNQSKTDAFEYYAKEIIGKKVTVIGHFKSLENKLQKAGILSIIEKEPKKGTFPDSASEYLLPEQDFIFITAMTLQNKTLPRLLQLAKNARVILIGPSLVLSEILFKYGVETLSGFYVENPNKAFTSVARDANKDFYQWGQKIIVKNP